MAKYLDGEGLKTLWGKVKSADDALRQSIENLEQSVTGGLIFKGEFNIDSSVNWTISKGETWVATAEMSGADGFLLEVGDVVISKLDITIAAYSWSPGYTFQDLNGKEYNFTDGFIIVNKNIDNAVTYSGSQVGDYLTPVFVQKDGAVKATEYYIATSVPGNAWFVHEVNFEEAKDADSNTVSTFYIDTKNSSTTNRAAIVVPATNGVGGAIQGDAMYLYINPSYINASINTLTSDEIDELIAEV